MTQIEKSKASRRSFLKVGAAAAATTLAAPAIVKAQETRVLKMQSAWGAAEIFQEMAKQYCDHVAAMSGGRITIDLLPAGSVVGAFQVMDAVHDGVIDLAHQVPVYWYAKHKGASLFGTGPVFGQNATNLLAWMNAGGGNEFLRELTQDILGLNVVSFFGFPMPAQPLGWFKNPVATAADVDGLKYRTVGLAADLMQSMGLSVVQLPGGEIVPAMDRGVIDAFEFNNPTADMRFGAQDVAKNYMLGSYHQASEFFEVDVNKTVWDGLAPDLQAILQLAMAAASTTNTGIALDNYSRDLAALATEHGVNILRTPDEVLAKQLEAWDALIATLEADAYIKKVMDSQRAWVERTVYYELMNAPSYRLAYDHYFPGKIPA